MNNALKLALEKGATMKMVAEDWEFLQVSQNQSRPYECANNALFLSKISYLIVLFFFKIYLIILHWGEEITIVNISNQHSNNVLFMNDLLLLKLL